MSIDSMTSSMMVNADHLALLAEQFMGDMNRLLQLQELHEDELDQAERAELERIENGLGDSWSMLTIAIGEYRRRALRLRQAVAAAHEPARTVFSNIAHRLVATAPPPSPPAPPLPPFTLSRGQQADMDEIAGI